MRDEEDVDENYSLDFFGCVEEPKERLDDLGLVG
jgi:hypothetical protein